MQNNILNMNISMLSSLKAIITSCVLFFSLVLNHEGLINMQVPLLTYELHLNFSFSSIRLF